MNLSKLYSVFDPLNDIKDSITIIGCGALGSNLAVMLARIGIPKLTLYDFDIVEEHNITNQAYRQQDIGKEKTAALTEILKDINPDIDIVVRKAYTHQILQGYIFLCLDNIETRQRVVEQNKDNTNIKAMFDLRMGLFDAQLYVQPWTEDGIKALSASMDFTHEEAQQNVPMSPCGTTLSVIPTVQTIVSHAVINLIRLVRDNEWKHVTLINLYTGETLTL